MDAKLQKPDVHSFSVAEHIEFHNSACPLCEKYEKVIDALELITGYRSKVLQEDVIYKWIRRSEYTEKKAEADYNRDRIYTGVMEIVRANMKHFDPSIRDSAGHVNNLLENYGDLIHAGYDSETAGINSIVTRLNGSDYSLAVQNLGLAAWVKELASQNALFKSYVEETSQEQFEKPEISPRTARRETDEALRKITVRVSALIDLNGPDAYADFAGEFNVLTNHYNTLVREHYGRLHAKTDISAANITPVAVQAYTGKPVYVIPEVWITKGETGKTVELVFSEDFTVAYKNNVNRGTATLIIKGMGKYDGELVTTFNIGQVET
jgi:hypothetical protein